MHACQRDVIMHPVEEITLAVFILRIMNSYLAGIRNAHIHAGFEWTLTGNETIRCVRRYVTRPFPSSDTGRKMPISMGILKTILPLLPGWPNTAEMTFEDLVFACASIIGTCGFLRGGEFLFKPGQTRLILRAAHITTRFLRGRAAVVVMWALATFWLTEVLVPFFEILGADAAFSPVRLWAALQLASPFTDAAGQPLDPSLPAFHTANGAPLRHDWMMARTSDLLKQAGIELMDARGQITSVKSSSWRAGGVRSAMDANLSEVMIMELGRWKSSAWASYLLHTGRDLCAAGRRMWDCAEAPSTPSSGPRVECEVSPGPLEVAGDAEIVQDVLRRSSRAKVARTRLVEE
jgi:hypothetical protein